MLFESLAFAMGPTPGAGGQASGTDMLVQFVPLILMFGIFWFLLIRPQQKRAKERQKLLDAIKSGDRIVFGGGILGTVTNVKEKTILVKIADNVKIEVSRGAVSQVLEKGDTPEDEQQK